MDYYRISGAVDHRGLVTDRILPVLQRKTRCTIPEASVEGKPGTVHQSGRRVPRRTMSADRSVSIQLLKLTDRHLIVRQAHNGVCIARVQNNFYCEFDKSIHIARKLTSYPFVKPNTRNIQTG